MLSGLRRRCEFDAEQGSGRVSISTETSGSGVPSIDWPTARSFISGFLLRRLAQPEPLTMERHPLRGGVLLTDVESFTAQVERLVRQGPEGLEQVISDFNRYFCMVGDSVRQYGGDVLEMFGDSFLCFWPAEDEQELGDATALAGQAALAILEAIGKSNPTTWLTRIGTAAGQVELGIIGGVGARWQVTPRGPALVDVVACERVAAAGTVLLSPQAAALLKGRATLRDTSDGRAELEQVLESATPPARAEPGPRDIPPERLDPMIPAPVRRWGLADHAWLADFRRVNVVIAHLGPPDDGACSAWSGSTRRFAASRKL